MIKIIKEKSLIIGILPTKKDDEAINILFQRERKRKHFDYLSDEELRKKVIRNYKAVKQAILNNINNIIYCENLGPEALVEKILNKIQIKDNFYK